jgi:hypothetical protein
MNERILELYKQAHMTREYPVNDPMRGGNPPTVYWGGESSAERFAKLIVQECCQKLEDDGMVEVAMEIKAHFGVKE